MEVAEAERRSSKDELHLRQAGEKAWLAVVEATDNYLLRHHGIRIAIDSSPHQARKRALRAVGADAMVEEYNALSGFLHGDVFYFGELTELPRLMVRARRYIEKATGHKVAVP